jgi:hypothetical protein
MRIECTVTASTDVIVRSSWSAGYLSATVAEEATSTAISHWKKTLVRDSTPNHYNKCQAHENSRRPHVFCAPRQFMVFVTVAVDRCFDGRVE